MVSAVAKGARVERIAIRILRRKGFFVHRTIRTPYATNAGYRCWTNDVFHCIDIIAKRLDAPTKWIQVTCRQSVVSKIRDLEVVPWTVEHDSVEIWQWNGRSKGRRNATAGGPVEDCYFQIYKRHEEYRRLVSNRAFATPQDLDT